MCIDLMNGIWVLVEEEINNKEYMKLIVNAGK
jgi:hypothetical protein